MKSLATVVLLLAFTAWAGEHYIGRIVVSDGGTVNNATTGYDSPGCAYSTTPGGPACSAASAFPIGVNTKLTLRCSEACCVSLDRSSTDGGICLEVAAGEKFPTSTQTTGVVSALPDGGTYVGGLVAITGVCGCKVFTRSGTE